MEIQTFIRGSPDYLVMVLRKFNFINSVSFIVYTEYESWQQKEEKISARLLGAVTCFLGAGY